MISSEVKSTLNQIPTLKDKGPLLVWMRHAERPKLKTDVGVEVDLTENGISTAKAYGAYLKELGVEFGTAFSSPFTRTKQTAQYIQEGANWVPKTETKILAVACGIEMMFPYEHRYEFAQFLIDQLGAQPAFHLWLDEDKKVSSNFNKPALAKKNYDAFLLETFEQLGNSNAVSIVASHDTMIMLSLATYFGVKTPTDEIWPQFLETVVFWKENGKIRAAWRNKVSSE